MKNLNSLNKFRDIETTKRLYGYAGDHEAGMFRIPSEEDGAEITVIASVGEGWDHVSASRVDRCPTWAEMEQIKHLFFKDNETAMQLHVPASEHINCHPRCLHLWRPIDAWLPKPPGWMVGTKKSVVAA